MGEVGPKGEQCESLPSGHCHTGDVSMSVCAAPVNQGRLGHGHDNHIGGPPHPGPYYIPHIGHSHVNHCIHLDIRDGKQGILYKVSEQNFNLWVLVCSFEKLSRENDRIK